MNSPGSLATIKGKIEWVGDPGDDSYAFGVSIQAQRLNSERDFYSTSLRGEAPEQDFTLANVEPERCVAAFTGDAEAQRALAPAHLAARRSFPGGLKSLMATRWGTSTVTRMG